MRPVRRLLPAALVLALVSILSASVGGAVAARLVTSADIQDRTIKVVDLDQQTVKALKGNRGPRGVKGKPGAVGAKGATGAAGAAGSALGYGRFAGDGSAILDDHHVTMVHAFTNGIYCLRYDGGRPDVVTVTIDPAGADSRKNFASATTDFITVLTTCGAPYKDANIAVFTADGYANTAAQASFAIAVIA